VPHDLGHRWSEIQAELRGAVSETTYHLWLEPLEPRRLDDAVLTVAAPDGARGWVADRFGRVLQTCVSAVLGEDVTVNVVARSEAGAHPGDRRGPHRAQRPRELFNPKYTFEQFVIGDGNRLAHGAALAVAELPGQAYNPLFVYGVPGVGKTHLLHAIANYSATYGETLTVRYTTAEDFANEFIGSLQAGRTEQFKAHFRRVDMLLIDDVQFLQSKARTEEEFFHTFNALYETGSQLVLTCDRLPRDMNALEDRLRERFEAGLVADIAPPDFGTRLAILRKRAEHDGLDVGDGEALDAIAMRITDNVRMLEGALIRVVAFGSLTGRPITPDIAQEVLDGLYPQLRRRASTMAEIQTATAEAFSVSVDELQSPSRAARVAWPRQVAMYLARELTDQTLPSIGAAFGGRNHTTVLYAVRRAGERMAADPAAYDAVRALTERLRGDDDRPA